MKPLSGREASVLALLAQSDRLSNADKRQLLSGLDGQALKIAQALIGDDTHPSKASREAVEGLRAWAENLHQPRRVG